MKPILFVVLFLCLCLIRNDGAHGLKHESNERRIDRLFLGAEHRGWQFLASVKSEAENLYLHVFVNSGAKNG